MNFNVSDGHFEDTLWQKKTGDNNECIRILRGTFDKKNSITKWEEKRETEDISIIRFEKNGMTLKNTDSSYDSLFIPFVSDSLVWNYETENYNCRISYRRRSDGLIAVDLSGRRGGESEDSIKIESKDVFVQSDGAGWGYITEESPNDCINYKLIIDLYKKSSFSGEKF
jgi:hypothetical protein